MGRGEIQTQNQLPARDAAEAAVPKSGHWRAPGRGAT